jgi:hypothetical protein
MAEFTRAQYVVFKQFLDLYSEYEDAYRSIYNTRTAIQIIPITAIEIEIVLNGASVQTAVDAALERYAELRPQGFEERSRESFLERITRFMDVFYRIRPLIFNRAFISILPSAKNLVELITRVSTPQFEIVEDPDPLRFVYLNSARFLHLVHTVKDNIDAFIQEVRGRIFGVDLGGVDVQNPPIGICFLLAIDQNRTLSKTQLSRRALKKGTGHFLLERGGYFRCNRPGCPNLTLHECSRCKVKAYCSEECQQMDYPNHRTQCRTIAAIVRNCDNPTSGGRKTKKRKRSRRNVSNR